MFAWFAYFAVENHLSVHSSQQGPCESVSKRQWKDSPQSAVGSKRRTRVSSGLRPTASGPPSVICLPLACLAREPWFPQPLGGRATLFCVFLRFLRRKCLRLCLGTTELSHLVSGKHFRETAKYAKYAKGVPSPSSFSRGSRISRFHFFGLRPEAALGPLR